MKPLVILGAGGHASVILDACRVGNRVVKGCIAPKTFGSDVRRDLDIIGDDSLLNDGGFLQEFDLILGIGELSVRRSLIDRLAGQGVCFNTVIHPGAIVSPTAEIGHGAFVNAGAVINTGAVLGNHVIVNTRCSVDHDCQIGANTHICPGSTLAGGVTCETDVFIGTGAVITSNCRIETGAVIGAGTTVRKDMDAGTRNF